MSERATLHQTLVFERRLRSAPSAVFRAYADVTLRARWSAPSDTAAVVYSASDFRVDGADHFRCGARDTLPFRGTVQYMDIVPDRRIVYSERIQTDTAPLAVSLVTWELTEDGTGTHLRVTDQVASFVGTEMIDGTKQGMTAALDHLVTTVDAA